jgi:tetratricopeptide (TPR) repeat protein
VKAKLGNLQEALDDASQALEVSVKSSFALQERGVLKYLMGDLDAALADLNESLELDADDYEVLKHRGYVKFLMDDKEGARIDAERALNVKPSRLDYFRYGCGPVLGVAPVEFLGYNLR